MTTYYVAPTGSDAAAGTSLGTAFQTISKAATVVVAGDTVNIRSGTYRETVTCTVSGTVGNPISWVGDYSGVVWGDAGGTVRITGSNDDITIARTTCIAATSVNYNNWTNVVCDLATTACISLTSCQNWIINKCAIAGGTIGINVAGASQLNITIRNCFIDLCGLSNQNGSIIFTHSSTVSNAGHVVESCVIFGAVGSTGSFTAGIGILRVGGITIKNCTIRGHYAGVAVWTALAVGQVVTLLNTIIAGTNTGLTATALGEIVADYTDLHNIAFPRANVAIGANDVAYPPLFDTRWFFEAVK